MSVNELVSIIVPVYNVEKYLERCVDSIISQTYTNLEIILIDDGSTDGSGTICDDYKKKDSRIKIIHKENGGLSDARNAGLDVAKGKFISFVDSDDYIDNEMISTLRNLIHDYDSDIAVCGCADCYENNVVVPSVDGICKVWNSIEAMKEVFIGNYFGVSVCTKLFRASMLANHRFKKGRTYEDAFFTPEVLFEANSVAYTSKQLYYYWHRSNSITTLAFNSKCMDVVDAYKSNLDFIKINCPELIDVGYFRLYWAYFIAFDRLIASEKYKSYKEYKIIKKYLKDNWLNIFKCKYFNRSRRIAILALKINVYLYLILAKLHVRRNKKINA